MIYANGKRYESARQNELLAGLEAEISDTRARLSLPPDVVADALSALGERAAAGEYAPLLSALGADGAQLGAALRQLSREALSFRLQNELGGLLPGSEALLPARDGRRLRRTVRPLGTLFHIAAGNAPGLAAFSAAEGLICGNVNIVKLPRSDGGLSAELLARLVEQEPRLAPFLYVFDTPSSDTAALQRMAAMSDGVVFWGGEAGELAARQLAPAGARLIAWGHKLSFAYISGYENEEAELAALARHIVETKQLLCSSCQNILLDTDSPAEAEAFCRRFLPHLEAAMQGGAPDSVGARAERALRAYTARLEALAGFEPVSAGGCSAAYSGRQELELSPMFGNVLVKAVPQRALFAALRRSKHLLQTAGLICLPSRRAALTELLQRAGVARVTRAGDMSAAFPGEAHDGRYPLAQYVRIAEAEE